ncbi:MAG: hypothetical protein MI810_05060 [Flavobacteriales bacterium]|nr:hypothetical protein [Flavobacteriales bacterium]
MRHWLFHILLLISTLSFAQQVDLSVPEEILNEMETVKVKVNDSTTYTFSVIQPKAFIDTTRVPVVLCLSGGNQSEEIVNYCYAAWFRTDMFNYAIKIIPHQLNGKNLRDLDSAEIVEMTTTIQKEFNTYTSDWIVLGTSNGGVGAFRFVQTQPELYSGMVVMPGAVLDIPIDKKWGHLNVLLAVGTEDNNFWHKETLKTEKRLKPFVNDVKTFEMKGIPHIVPLDYKIDVVYQAYHNLETNN